METQDILFYRLRNQHITCQTLQSPQEVVAWHGAMQAQDFSGAKWAVGLRLRGSTDAAIDQAFAEGVILRTHVMRPTWHFVAPADIRWLLQLTVPRVHAMNGTMYRRLELDNVLFLRCRTVIENAFQGGRQFTRAELGEVLSGAGVAAQGMRLGYIMHWAELEGVVCSGARRGKQFTYALLEERVPPVPALSRDEALAELVRRYFTSHGPATMKDFSWWSGLTQADGLAGLDMLGPQLVVEEVGGKKYYLSPTMPAEMDPSPIIYLLPPFDEYTIAYNDRSGMLDPAFARQARETFYGGALVIDGQVVGYWRRSIKKITVELKLDPFRALEARESQSVAAAAQRYGEFLGLPVKIA